MEFRTIEDIREEIRLLRKKFKSRSGCIEFDRYEKEYERDFDVLINELRAKSQELRRVR